MDGDESDGVAVVGAGAGGDVAGLGVGPSITGGSCGGVMGGGNAGTVTADGAAAAGGDASGFVSSNAAEIEEFNGSLFLFCRT